MFFYILYKTGYILANILPLRFAYWLAERFSDVQYWTAKKDREAVASNLSIVLKKDVSECRVMAQRVFRNFGLYLVDFFRMARLDGEFIKKRVHIEGLEKVEDALTQKRGAVIVTGHIGNWEMGGAIMAIMGYGISAVALNHKHKNINDFFIGQREKRGLKVIRIGSIMKRCISALLKNELLALVGDRDFTGSGTLVDFFGVPTGIPTGPAMLALKTGSPIIPGFFLRENRFSFRFIFDSPIEVTDLLDADKGEKVKKITERCISVIERYIRKYPEQWLVFRKFWETPVDAFVL